MDKYIGRETHRRGRSASGTMNWYLQRAWVYLQRFQGDQSLSTLRTTGSKKAQRHERVLSTRTKQAEILVDTGMPSATGIESICTSVHVSGSGLRWSLIFLAQRQRLNRYSQALFNFLLVNNMPQQAINTPWPCSCPFALHASLIFWGLENSQSE